jgi:hypothetical protein
MGLEISSIGSIHVSNKTKEIMNREFGKGRIQVWMFKRDQRKAFHGRFLPIDKTPMHSST